MTGQQIKGLKSLLSITIMVAALYAITGNLGLILASGSPYSTAIWIPSGIALGAVLVFGLEALPGIFLGSLLVNYHVTSIINLEFLKFWPLLIGSVIATGATLQAFVGWLIIRKWMGLNNPLNEPNDILLFALLSGPVSCLVNTTTSNIALFALNVLPLENILESWITWYIGDMIGVLIFTPVFMILFAKPRSLWRPRIIPILLPLCVSFFLVTLAYTFVRNDVALASQLWFVLVCGLLFCVLVNIVLFIIIGQKDIMQLEMKEILRSAGESVYGVDLNEKVIFVNPATLKMWKRKESEIIGKPIHDFIDSVNTASTMLHDKQCPVHAAFKFNRTSHITNELLFRSDGSSFWAEYTCTPLVVSGKTKGAVIIVNDISNRREAEFRMERLAHFDTLTSLPNRLSFIDTLKKSLLRLDKDSNNLSVCFLDIDNFKNINDSLGHATGDIALQQISLLISEAIDESDYIARLGGDEFGIILFNKKSAQEINRVIENIMQITRDPVKVRETIINISISIGVASFPIAGVSADDLIKNADIAMYHAKELGKNTFAHFNLELRKSIHRSHLIESEMRNALLRNEFYLHYQPQVGVPGDKIIGLEVLLRWQNPVLGYVSPGEFIPIAERNGMIIPIGQWVLTQLLKEYHEVISTFTKNIKISMNISILQLGDSRFYDSLVNALTANPALKKILMLEITETALMSNPTETIAQMQRINELGINFSLDDFGIHYSSMRYLKSLPISQLKIDYFFIKDIQTDKNDYAIVNTIIQLSNILGIPAIAEGVETKEQLDILTQLGCSYIQGYYFYKPLPLNELTNVLSRQT